MSFPISPVNGQTTTVNGVLYTYNSTTTAWNVTTAFTGNIVTTTLSATGTVTGASVVGGVITGTSLSASGNVTGGNVTTAGIGNIGTLAVTGTTTLTGNTTAGHLLPAANITYDLGSATAQWRTLYVSGNTINMGGATIQTDTGSGSFAFVPPATAASPNPTGVVFGPGGNISTVSTTAGTITANLQVAGSTTSTILKITSISYPNDDTAADTAGGQTITLGGSGFLSGAQVLIGTSPMTTVGSVTVVSAVSITFVSPAGSSGNYPVYVVNSDGATAIALPGIAYSGTPTWSTASGNIAQVYEVSSTSTTVTATGDAPISYSVFSGSLPTSVSLNSSTGVISGTTVATASSTTYSFTIRATDAQQQDTNRAFTITVIPDVVTWSSPAANSTVTLGQSLASTTTLLATSAASNAITYTANALPTGLSISGATVTGTPTVVGNTTSTFTATAATTGRTTTATINWAVTVSGDTYFPYTTLLLSGGTATETFIADASANNFALAIAGDTKPNNFNPYTPGYYSNYFDGTGDYLSIANNAALNLGNNSWTCELWIYPTGNYTTYNTLFAKRNSASLCAYEGYLTPTNGYLGYYNGTLYSSTTAPNTGKWNHIAYVFDGTNIKIYLNGTQVLSSATSNADQAVDLYIGMYNHSGTPYDYYFGYISNFRLVKGVAVYTGTFTPPTAPLTATQSSGTNISAITGTQTSLLTCQSNRFLDNSTNLFAITVYGNTTVNPNNPFVPNTQYATYGSTYFDGTGDYLTVPSNAAFAMGTGDFTIECWINTSLVDAQDDVIIELRSSGATSTGFVFNLNPTGIGYQLNFYTDGAFNLGSTVLNYNVWNHCAVTRSGTTVRLFSNGALSATFTKANNFSDTPVVYIGNSPLYSPSDTIGYISNFRVVKGTAVYTSAFTPPSAPLTAITNTSLLTLQTNQPANNSVFLDSSTNALAVTRAGNTSAGTFSPYGANWSNYFGSANYISAASNAAFGFGTGDFTVEAWVYPNAAYTTYNYIWATGVTNGLVFYVLGGVLYVRTYNGSDLLASSTAPALNTWTHVAVTRSGTTLRIFVNGVQTGTTTNSTDFATGSGLVGNDGANAAPWLGYISNMRVVKGTAVYTTTFTPSTTPLTAIANTSILTCQSNRFVDNSANAFTITKTGDVAVQRFSPFSPSAAYTAGTIGGSAYFDGTGDYLTVPTATPIVLSGTVWTIECWCYLTSSSFSTYRVVINKRSGSDAASYDLFFNITTGYLAFYNGTQYTSSAVPIINAWNHIAAVYDGTNINLYMNGVRVLQTATTNPDNGGNLYIGADENGTSNFVIGYINDVRVLKGTVLYSGATYTVPSTPLTAITNTSLLLNMTSAGVYDSTMINDLETVGDAKILSTQTPYAGSYYSNYFDGTGDYLTAGTTASNFLCTGSATGITATLEAWVYPTAYNTNGSPWMFSSVHSKGNVYFNFGVRNGAVRFYWFDGTNPNTVDSASTSDVPLNTWTHIAATISGTTIKIYVNGTLNTTSATYNGVAAAGSGGTENISIELNVPTYFSGYISNYRLNNTVVYTSTFTPGITPLTAISGTNLLTCQSNRFLDNSTNAFTITRAGDTSVQSFNPFQRNSATTMSFDGTGDWLVPRNLLPLGSGNFTVEMWLYPNATYSGAYAGILDSRTSGDGVGLVYFGYTGTANQIGWKDNTTNVVTGSVTLSTWNHVAIARSNGTMTMYVNGTSTSSSANSTNYTVAFRLIGASFDPLAFNGYINDFRITKGVARYTSTFTPPTTAFIAR